MEAIKVHIPTLGTCKVLSSGVKMTQVFRDVPIFIDVGRPLGFREEIYWIKNEYIRAISDEDTKRDEDTK